MEQTENQVFAKFFFTMLKTKTNLDECYFYFPSSDCFTYFTTELSYCIYINEKNKLRNHFILDLSRHFYEFMEKDDVFFRINSLDYSVLLSTLKEIYEGKDFDSREVCSFMNKLRHKYSFSFFKLVCDDIISECKKETVDFSRTFYLTDLFLNETLARNTDIRFVSWFLKNRTAGVSICDFISYFLNRNEDTYDILLPITNMTSQNEDVFEIKEQTMIKKNDLYYAKVYANYTIDFFFHINSSMTRIDSIFNILKMYTQSKIDFDFNKDIEVNIIYSKGTSSFNIPFRKLINYKGVSPFSKHLVEVVTNLDTLSEKEVDSYHKILNIISYAEKDNDLISPSSLVDSWIALETLFSFGVGKKGFDAVLTYLPMVISSKFLINKITFLLSSSFRKKVTAENFIEQANGGKVEDLVAEVKNPFYRYELEKMALGFVDFKNLHSLYSAIEKKIEIDIHRIYNLRNEYVHNSNLNAFSSMQPYYLKNYLTISIDCYFKILSQTIDNKYVSPSGFAFDVFLKMIDKNTARRNLFKFACEKRKKANTGELLSISEIDDKTTCFQIMLNVIFNNADVLKKYDPNKEQQK